MASITMKHPVRPTPALQGKQKGKKKERERERERERKVQMNLLRNQHIIKLF